MKKFALCAALVMTLAACGGGGGGGGGSSADAGGGGGGSGSNPATPSMMNSFASFVASLIGSSPDNTEPVAIDSVGLNTSDNTEPSPLM